MIGSVELYGLKIENISPVSLSNVVNTNTKISITFNGDLNTGSIPGNVAVIRDLNDTFKDINSLLDTYSYEYIQGKVSYKDKTIIFTPSENLLNSSRYVIIVKKEIKDILGRGMVSDFISSFYTGSSETIKPTLFLTPKDNSYFKELPEFSWTVSSKALYTFQVSSSQTFESIIFEKELITNSLKPETVLPNNIYYARVKAVDTTWSRTLQFYLNTIEDYPVTKEDNVFDLNFLNELETDIEIIDIYPKDNDVNIDTKLNSLYIKAKGKVNYSDLNYFENMLKGNSYDDNASEDHGEVNTKTIIVYDDTENISYVILNIE